MKLLRLTAEGFGSPRLEVDFTAPECQCGAFGIVGATTLQRKALWRSLAVALGVLAPSEEASGALAEVLFESQGSVWMSRFSLGKSRAGGALEASQTLFRQRPDGEWEAVAEGGAPCREALLQRCGVDADALATSSLMDQRRFLAFLQAAPGQREALLEEVAPPAGCREISRRVHGEAFRRRRIVEGLEAREAAVELLDDEALAALRSRAADLKGQVEDARRKSEAAASELSAVKKREDLKRLVEEAEASLEKALEQERRFSETRERLERAKLASTFTPALEEIGRLAEAIAALGSELLAADHETNESALALESCRQKSLAARAEYDAAAEASRELARMAPDIEAIDRRIAERALAKGYAEEAVDAAKKSLEARAAELEALRKTEKALVDARVAIDSKLEKSEKDAALSAGLSGLCEQAKHLEAAREGLSALEAAGKQAASRASSEASALKEGERRAVRAHDALEQAKENVRAVQARLDEARGGRDSASQLAAISSLEKQLSLVKSFAAAKAAIARAESDESKAKGRLAEAEKASREGDQKALQAKKSGIEMTAAFSRTAGEKAERLRSLRFDEIPKAAAAKAACVSALARLAAEDKALFKRFEEEGQAQLERSLSDEKSALLSWGRKVEGEEQRLQDARKAVYGAQEALEACLGELQALQASSGASGQALESLRDESERKASEVRSLEEAWAAAVSPFGFAGSQLSPARLAALLEERGRARAVALSDRALNEKAMAVKRSLVARAESEWQSARAVLEAAQAGLSEARQAEAQEEQERAALFGERSLSEERKRAASRLEKAAAERDALGLKVREAQSVCAQDEAVASRIRSRIASLAAEKEACESRLDAALEASFGSREELMLARRNAEAVAGWEKEEAAIKAGIRWARERLAAAKDDLARHQAKSPSDAGLAEARAASDGAAEHCAGLIRELSFAEHELERDAQQRGKRDEARREGACARAELARWEALDARIGSEDGARFSRYALGLVFKRLLAFASVELVTLTGRLALSGLEGAPFDFAVVDNARNCALRRPEALSGAEALAVSLALAAGFARMRGEDGKAQGCDLVFLDAAPALLESAEAQPLLRHAISRLCSQGKRTAVLAESCAETAVLPAWLSL